MTYCLLHQKNIFFIFDSSLYYQIDGEAMESFLGSTLGNAFLCHYEKDWLDSCPAEFKPNSTKGTLMASL